MECPLDSAELHWDNHFNPAACHRAVQRANCYGSKFSKQAECNIYSAIAVKITHFSDSVSSQSANLAGHPSDGVRRMVVQLYSQLMVSQPQERHEIEEQTSPSQF